MLGRKQGSKNADWEKTFREIRHLVPRGELEQLISKTVKDVREKTKGKRAAYAWSGGKDSLVLGGICQQAGVIPCVLVICNLEYRAFMEWAGAHKPPGLSVVNTGQDIGWLAAHPQMLFPQDSKRAAQWFQIVQHRGQAKYCRENGIGMLLLGRRKADGNYVGKGGNAYTDRQGVEKYSPLAEWTHEQVLAYIHYHGLEMPPIYGWKNGYLCGTHPWPARQWTGSIGNAWAEIYGIDPSIVAGAAGHIQSAKEFLEALGRPPADGGIASGRPPVQAANFTICR